MKITKEHIGAKVKLPWWPKDAWFKVEYIGRKYMIGLNHKCQEVYHDIGHNTWELVPEGIPKQQSWVVPGKKYIFDDIDTTFDKNNWFMPTEYDIEDRQWKGVNSKSNIEYAIMNNKYEWKEYKEDVYFNVRLSPALYLENGQETVSRTLYASEEEAKKHLRGKYFIKWPVAYSVCVARKVAND